MKNEPDKLARVLKVLAVGTRVRLIQLLRQRTLCVNALAARLDVTQGAVSQHLRVMRDADLVIDERRGYRVHYRLNEETLEQWRTEIDALLAPLERGSTGNTPTEQGERPCAAMRRNKDAGGQTI
ncbi:MAG: helix-turn-helix transcriptional regulator [Lentisphaerae bacterium]|jgi:DNA-binding transcriptional ArsR family regulator|nr:helix-turn-helix transcriptional regulator [Lentisphaerota bacterium]MBT5613146.1 helix-turn-helix transcriptional regulator [Lentisphaerota bacterium]MBT7060567.1 helix-turn-helix transcriptional regulator [Lentisphaerota bacterium]MBT7848190.1 helix-turn-helix transcriptional regulator [Lentisphaerota bacterium]